MRKPLTTCLLSLAAGSLLVLPGAAHATVLSCGDQLTQNTTLTADLHCGDGAPTVPRPDGTDSYASILIAADDITLDLNGHEISSYTGDAIVAYGRRNISIRNGIVWGISLNDTTDSHIYGIDTAGSFGSGIGLSGSHRNRIERNRVRGEAGIGLGHSSDNLVADNDIGAPAGALSMSNAHRNRIVHNSLCGGMGGPLRTSNADHNLFRRNLVPSTLPGIPGSPHCHGLGGEGFDIGPDSSGNRLIENNVSGIEAAGPELGLDDPNGDGIDVQSPGNYLAHNTANDNARYGISAVPGNQSGINYATGNGNPAQCLNVICRPGPGRPAPAGPRPAPKPGQPTTPTDHVAPRARLVRQASQRLGRSLRLTVTARNENLWLSATASIRISGAARAYTLALPRARYIAKGDTRTVKLRLGSKLQARLARWLDQGRTVTAELTLTLRDQAGNSRTKRHTLKLTPPRL